MSSIAPLPDAARAELEVVYVRNTAAVGLQYGMLRRLDGLSFVLGTLLSMPRSQMIELVSMCGGAVIESADADCFFVYSDAAGLSAAGVKQLRRIGAYGIAESVFARALAASPEELELGQEPGPFIEALPAGLVHGWPA